MSDLPITEQENERSRGLDTLTIEDTLALINDEDHGVPVAVRRELPNITRAVEGIVARLRQGGRLIYVGTGTSGRLGVLDASECPPTYGVPAELVQGLIAGGYDACHRAVEASEDDRDAGASDLAARGVTAADAVIGIAASGRTPYTIGAVGPRARARRIHRGHHLRPRIGDHRGRRRRHRARRRAGSGRGFDAHEGRHRTEAGAEHDLDDGDDPARVRARQPDDEHAGPQQQAAGARRPHPAVGDGAR